jgi:hypothetical protein
MVTYVRRRGRGRGKNPLSRSQPGLSTARPNRDQWVSPRMGANGVRSSLERDESIDAAPEQSREIIGGAAQDPAGSKVDTDPRGDAIGQFRPVQHGSGAKDSGDTGSGSMGGGTSSGARGNSKGSGSTGGGAGGGAGDR